MFVCNCAIDVICWPVPQVQFEELVYLPFPRTQIGGGGLLVLLGALTFLLHFAVDAGGFVC